MPATLPAAEHRQRADLALGEQGDRVAHRRVAVDGQDLAPLGLEDGGDGHGPLPSHAQRERQRDLGP